MVKLCESPLHVSFPTFPGKIRNPSVHLNKSRNSSVFAIQINISKPQI